MYHVHRLGSLGLLILSSSVLLAHPGRTDSSGGHHDRKNGGYHYHNSGARVSSSPPVAWSLPSPIQKVRTTARTEARTQVRTSTRENTIASSFKHAIANEDARRQQKHVPDEQTKPVLEKANFILFFKGGRVLELVSFDRTSDGYEVVATHGGQAFYPELMVERIEPLNQTRIWKDISGRFQIEAIYVDVVSNEVQLKKQDGTIINVSVALLSADDRKLIEAIQAAPRNSL